MAYIKVDKEKCKGCGFCIIYCPNKLVLSSDAMNKRGVHAVEFVDKDGKCTGCAMCAIMCPDCVIEVWK